MEKPGHSALIPLDGSPYSEGILGPLHMLSLHERLAATLFHVAPTPQDRARSTEQLNDLAHRLESPRLQVSVEVASGSPAAQILMFSRLRRVSFIAMATHGRSGITRTLLGSVAEDVLRHATVPVLLHRPGGTLAPLQRLVLALDGTPEAEAVLPEAVSLSRAHRADLHVLTVVEHGRSSDPIHYQDALCARIRREGVEAIPVVRKGAPGRVLVDYVREIEAGLVLMCTHGRTGLARAYFGSVAEEVLRASPCPVFIRRVQPSVHLVPHGPG